MYRFRISKHDLPPGDVFRKAALRTLQRVTRSAESFAIRQIKKAYNVPRDVADRSITAKAASIRGLKAALIVYDRPIPLSVFARNLESRVGTRKPVVVEIVKGQRKTVSGPVFAARMASGHVGVFRRREAAGKVAPKQGKYAGRKVKRGPLAGQPILRQPIEQQYSHVTVAGMFKGRRVLPELEKHVKERIAIEYPHQLQFLTRNKGA